MDKDQVEKDGGAQRPKTLRLREFMRSKGVEDEKAIDLLEKMFIMNPDKRITVADILKDPYLNGVGDEAPCDPKDLPRLLSY